MSVFVAIISTADPSLGRVDKASLSQLTLMELLVDKITNHEKIFHPMRNPENLSDWAINGKLTFDTDSEPGNQLITEIKFQGLLLQGSVQLEWLPLSVRLCVLSYNELSGTIQLTDLPDTLEKVAMIRNKFVGSLDLTHLPRAMYYFDVERNMFDGSVCLTQLPHAMKWLNLCRNHLSGRVDLTNLPQSIESVFLHTNGFEGETDFSMLPKNLVRLKISDTKLSGVIRQKKDTLYFVDGSNVILEDSG